ncbi:hypothetical protein J6590_006373 [Homalodisca vitripennis]|nr:hypothetical protein J6590_006373 [Homalodisca vitripennis]
MLREMASKLSSKSVISAATGLQLPVIGLGTFQAWLFNYEEAVLVNTLNTALELGYRLIDTAFLYHNEHIIGKVLQEWFISGRLRRDDFFVTTKLPPQGANPKYVEEFIEKQLKALQLEYVDLYLVHHAIGWKHGEELHLSEGDNDNSGLQLDPTTDHVAMEGKLISIFLS